MRGVREWVCAGEVLSHMLPDLFPAHRGAGAAKEDGAGEPELAPTVIVQGIQAPLSTPALWLCQQLACADTMLYVCVRPPLGEAEDPGGAA